MLSSDECAYGYKLDYMKRCVSMGGTESVWKNWFTYVLAAFVGVLGLFSIYLVLLYKKKEDEINRLIKEDKPNELSKISST
jgi:hypothetical protein